MKRIIAFFVVATILLCTLSYCSIFLKKVERVGEHDFIINGEKYVGVGIAYTTTGRKIAQYDGFDIRVIPEDKDHNFLAVRSFLDGWTMVKESYVIPTSGEVTVAYLDYHERVTEGIKWDMIQSILNEDFQGEFVIKDEELFEGSYDTNINYATNYIWVGYENCPVGTDIIGKFGKINEKLVFIKEKDFSINEFDLKYTCYIIKDEYQELFDFKNHEFKVITE